MPRLYPIPVKSLILGEGPNHSDISIFETPWVIPVHSLFGELGGHRGLTLHVFLLIQVPNTFSPACFPERKLRKIDVIRIDLVCAPPTFIPCMAPVCLCCRSRPSPAVLPEPCSSTCVAVPTCLVPAPASLPSPLHT